MRVLHAIHDYLPSHRSGSEIYAHSLAMALGSRGHDVAVLCAETDLSRKSGDLIERQVDGVRVHEIINNWSSSDFSESYLPRALAGPLRDLLRRIRPDVVHVHNLLNLSFDLPRLARREGAAVVATLHDFTLFCASGGQRLHLAERHVCHDIDFDRCSRCFRDTPFFRLMEAQTASVAVPAWVARWFGAPTRPPSISPAAFALRFERAARLGSEIELFVSPSRALAVDAIRFGLPADRVEVSGNGLELFEPPVKSPRSDGPLRIGFIGTLIWHKGTHVLIEALGQLPVDRYLARIHGFLDWNPDYVAQLRRAAHGLPVEFAGGFGPGESARILAELDVVVVPSLWPENAPMVILEAFRAGVPVVAARVGGIPELISDGVWGATYEPHSAADLASELAKLISDPERLSRYVAALPPVKSIRVDAADWERRYQGAVSRRAKR